MFDLPHDIGFVRGSPNLADMINGNRLDAYIFYFLVLLEKENTQ